MSSRQILPPASDAPSTPLFATAPRQVPGRCGPTQPVVGVAAPNLTKTRDIDQRGRMLTIDAR